LTPQNNFKAVTQFYEIQQCYCSTQTSVITASTFSVRYIWSAVSARCSMLIVDSSTLLFEVSFLAFSCRCPYTARYQFISYFTIELMHSVDSIMH